MKTLLESIGAKIKTSRIDAGVSQEQLSSLSGVQRSQISKIESGMVDAQISTIQKVAEALNVTLESLFIDYEPRYEIHPFVKWAGGKTQILQAIQDNLPPFFNTYFEPFIGGGALFFKLQPKKAHINDMNSELMCVYECLRSSACFLKLKLLLIEHEKNHCEDYYYQIREMDRKADFLDLPIEIRAARLIYLNKSCFNGLYRVNSKGYFNVPSNKSEKISCFDRKTFNDLGVFFQKSQINVTNIDFEKAVQKARAGDFVYFDPPYDTWEEKESFTSYDKNVFGKEEQARLAKCFRSLADRGVFVMLSNHNTKYVNELYSEFHIKVVKARRMINSKASGRGAVEEVLITNYE